MTHETGLDTAYPTLAALITDGTRSEVRTRSMAVFGIGIGMSFIVALIAGPVIAAFAGVPALFWIAAVLAIVGAAMLRLMPAEIERPAVPPSWNLRPALRPDLLRLDFYVFLLHAILTASFVALPFLFVDRLELAVTDHWKMYIGALLLSLGGTIPLIIRDERQGKGSTIGIAVSLMLAGQQKKNVEIVAEGRWLPSVADALRMLGTFLLALLAWVFFRAASLGDAFRYLGAIFGGPFSTGEHGRLVLPALFCLVLLVTEWSGRAKQHTLQADGAPRFVRWPVYVVVLFAILLLGNFTEQAFIYFQF